MLRRTMMETPLGPMVIAASDSGVTGIYFVGQRYFPEAAESWPVVADDPLLARAALQVRDYFAGRRQAFDIPLDLRGTPFQQRVWKTLLKVPFGQTTTYGALAGRLGKPSAARAVGAAVGRNPVSVVVPCHRVVGQDGSLTGYAGGLDRKRGLLDLERR